LPLADFPAKAVEEADQLLKQAAQKKPDTNVGARVQPK